VETLCYLGLNHISTFWIWYRERSAYAFGHTQSHATQYISNTSNLKLVLTITGLRTTPFCMSRMAYDVGSS